MALTNSQYDTIMRGYDRRQYENYRSNAPGPTRFMKRFHGSERFRRAMSACSVRQAETTFGRRARRSEDTPSGTTYLVRNGTASEKCRLSR